MYFSFVENCFLIKMNTTPFNPLAVSVIKRKHKSADHEIRKVENKDHPFS